jgi:protein-disulfide isomerase
MIQRVALAASLALVCSWLAACRPTAPGTSDPGSSQPVAMLDGKPITQGELDAWIKEELFRNQTEDRGTAELYELRSRALDRLVDERLLEEAAKKRGVSTEEYLRLEREARGKVTDEEITSFYLQNKGRMGGATRDQVADRIRSYLEDQRSSMITADLRKEAELEVLLEAPRVTVGSEGPSRGPADAPVTIVEFSDFQCPYCGRAEATIKQILERYPTQVRLVYRHLPLDRIHPFARGAAEAAVCADAQGKFWEYKDKLFANQQKLAAADLQGYAKAVGLDVKAFDACVKEKKTASAVVDRDLAAATAAGTAAGKRGLGTPAFFVNGILLSGAKPVEEFATVIDGELARAGSPPPAAAGS